MTIAICLQVGDGVVLGTDSASTLVEGGVAHNSYFTGEKMLNLVCGLPVGLATYGLGGIGGRSVIRLARDLRHELSTNGSGNYLAPEAYTIEDVAKHVRRFFFEERYLPEVAGDPDAPGLGFIIAGYSANATSPEVWEVTMQGNACGEPRNTFGQDVAGVLWQGQGEALTRLMRGYATDLADRLTDAGIDPNVFVPLLDSIAPLWHAAMPIQDAIDLVQYLADVVCGYIRFSPGALTVAPPIDLAAITVHEGFRWVARKHYYPSHLNPPDKYTSPNPRRKEMST